MTGKVAIITGGYRGTRAGWWGVHLLEAYEFSTNQELR
jgi:hypothetical protein